MMMEYAEAMGRESPEAMGRESPERPPVTVPALQDSPLWNLSPIQQPGTHYVQTYNQMSSVGDSLVQVFQSPTASGATGLNAASLERDTHGAMIPGDEPQDRFDPKTGKGKRSRVRRGNQSLFLPAGSTPLPAGEHEVGTTGNNWEPGAIRTEGLPTAGRTRVRAAFFDSGTGCEQGKSARRSRTENAGNPEGEDFLKIAKRARTKKMADDSMTGTWSDGQREWRLPPGVANAAATDEGQSTEVALAAPGDILSDILAETSGGDWSETVGMPEFEATLGVEVEPGRCSKLAVDMIDVWADPDDMLLAFDQSAKLPVATAANLGDDLPSTLPVDQGYNCESELEKNDTKSIGRRLVFDAGRRSLEPKKRPRDEGMAQSAHMPMYLGVTISDDVKGDAQGGDWPRGSPWASTTAQQFASETRGAGAAVLVGGSETVPSGRASGRLEVEDESPELEHRTKKVKRSPIAGGGGPPAEPNKKCNCKRSRCMKLYCDCFANGSFCGPECSCTGCGNHNDNVDEVMTQRQSIAQRNPKAFEPKVVAADNSPLLGADGGETPVSAKHKTGCNCKKSMCTKKYCECFQVGVGCSEGCNCTNCQNTYGRKAGPEGEEGTAAMVPHTERVRKVQRESTKKRRDLSPTTPAPGLDMQGKKGEKTAGRTPGPNRDHNRGQPSPSPSATPFATPRLPLPRPSRHPAPSASQLNGAELTSPVSESKLRAMKPNPLWRRSGDVNSLTPAQHPPASLAPSPSPFAKPEPLLSEATNREEWAGYEPLKEGTATMPPSRSPQVECGPAEGWLTSCDKLGSPLRQPASLCYALPRALSDIPDFLSDELPTKGDGPMRDLESPLRIRLATGQSPNRKRVSPVRQHRRSPIKLGQLPMLQGPTPVLPANGSAVPTLTSPLSAVGGSGWLSSKSGMGSALSRIGRKITLQSLARPAEQGEPAGRE